MAANESNGAQLSLGASPSYEAHRRPRFKRSSEFQAELRRRVEEYLESHAGRKQDCPQMYLKTAIILAIFGVSYWLLVFVATAWWQAVPLALLLGLAMAGIGFNIQHDAGHHAYSRLPWMNRLMSMTLDLVGGSSYLWHWKHVVFHHTYTNIAGHDTDIDLGVLGRLAPHQKRYGFHRFQFLYLWPLYGVIVLKWHLFDDFEAVLTGKVGEHRFPRPKGLDLLIFAGGKIFFLLLAFGIPLLVRPFWMVALFYLMIALSAGIVISVVFQLAHCVEEAEFPVPREDTGRIENAWAIHQVETTVDFARGSRIVTWLLGGLNFQVEHHLFPRICHIHYPAISKVVEETCRDFGIKYLEHKTVGAGIASHFRWLRTMGLPTAQ